MNKFFTLTLILCAVLASITACGGVPFVAQNEPTATSTRRIRPTFTPKPRATATNEIPPTEEPEPTQEPEPTDEPQPTDEPPTPAPKPVTKAPAAPKPTQPPAPTEVPKPQFTINATSQYLCEQQGIYKLIINAKRGRAFAGGLVFGVFDQSGRLLQDGAGKNLIGETKSDINVSIGSNCRVEADFVNPNSSNGELDVGDAVRAGTNPVVVRFIKSADDLTPLSPDMPVNFGNGGQYWMYIQAQ